ncbi:MAG: threonine synthase [Actinomycetota bacterium]|nr:threonine synthase [Actinomycetota bacterium]
MDPREDEPAREVRAGIRLIQNRLTHLECARCGHAHDANVVQNRCDCGGTLLVRYDLSRPIDLAVVRRRPAGIWRYRELLPNRDEPVSLQEAATPLLFAPQLSERFGLDIFVKDESQLPGGTFKARGAAVGLSRARELGIKEAVMPSAGNAGGSWALYAARAGLSLTVTMARTAPQMNQLEVEMAGATLELVDGTIADAARRAREIAAETGAFMAATFNEPYRVEGKKTAWLETFDQFGDGSSMRIPHTIIAPVGGGVAAVAAAKAADEVRALGWTDDPPPRLIGVQPEDVAPIVAAFERGDDEVEPWRGDAMTVASGLRVPAPSEGWLVLREVRASGGRMLAASEDDIVAAVGTLASSEGIFACPEGAATLVALERLAAEGDIEGPVVLYNTGAGAKYAVELARR